jgi:hypothetical protein
VILSSTPPLSAKRLAKNQSCPWLPVSVSASVSLNAVCVAPSLPFSQ